MTMQKKSPGRQHFCFLEVSQKSLPQYETYIVESLKKSCAVGLAVHSPVSESISAWRDGESLEQWYPRNKCAALQEQIISIGLSVAIRENDATIEGKPKISVRIFNLTTCTMATSKVRHEDILRMIDLGYDYNYIAADGIPYYRGRDDTVHQSELSQRIRKIFLAVHGHGDGSHPVIVRNGFTDLLLAFGAFVGVPSDAAKEFLQRIYDLFPGKIYDAQILPKTGQSDSDNLPFCCDFSLNSVDESDVFCISDTAGDRMPAVKRPNTRHPAVVDAFDNLVAFLRLFSTNEEFEQLLDKKISGIEDLAKIENRISCAGMPAPVLIEPIPNSRFRNPKRHHNVFDFTVPLSDVL